MLISDFMGQYHQATASGTEKLTGTKGVENMVSSLRSLTKGNIFEGTVSSVKNGRVTLALSSGQQVTARMDGKVSLTIGQSMFFQVKSNDGSQIAIRPFVVDGNGGNYALMQALSAAGLSTEPRYLSMVNRMMEEHMPIDRASLQQMARLVNANSGINVQTLVQLQKLGIPITPENAAQFENYLIDKQAITAELDQFIGELPAAFSGEDMPVEQMRQISSEVLAVITEDLPEIPQGDPLLYASQEGAFAESLSTVSPESSGAVFAEQTMQGTEQQVMQEAAPETMQSVPENEGQPPSDQAVETAQQNLTEAAPENLQQINGNASQTTYAVPHTLGAVLDASQLEHLNKMIGELLGTEETNYSGDSGAVEVLKDLQQLFRDPLPLIKEHLGKLLSSEEFKGLVRDTLEQQWMVKPSELTEQDKIGKLYEKLNDQVQRIETAVKAVGQESTNLTQMAAEIRSNVEFMNQINQLYTYVQIPLKMSGQNASGELYVYTNKKALAEGNEDLTAFLHLDMDHLGPTDISVRLRGHEVSANFYLDNDAAYALIEKNYPVLEERLRKKGYDCKISVINEEKHVNFVEDFLKKDQPSAGQLHRYSFDMRA